MLAGQRTSWTSKIHEEMIAEVARIWEKRENGFHFYSLPLLPLPLGRGEACLPVGRDEEVWIKMQPIFKPLSNRSKNSKTSWIDFQKLAYILHNLTLIMLTRRDILMELKRMGVRKPSLLKSYLRDFEKYIGNHYSFEILKTKKKLDPLPSQVSESRQNKPLYSWFSHGKAVLRLLGLLSLLGLLGW